MSKIQKQIEKKEKELKELKKKLAIELDKSKWIKIPELKIEVQSKIHHKGKSYDEIKEELGDFEDKLLTYDQIQKLKNLEKQGKYNLGLNDTWEFVKQQDLEMKEKGRVARFYAYSDVVDLYCYRDSSYSYSVLGVRFFRSLK